MQGESSRKRLHSTLLIADFPGRKQRLKGAKYNLDPFSCFFKAAARNHVVVDFLSCAHAPKSLGESRDFCFSRKKRKNNGGSRIVDSHFAFLADGFCRPIWAESDGPGGGALLCSPPCPQRLAGD